jgi:hypothetical protein
VINGVTELLFGWDVGHLHARPVRSILPAVIGAANAIILNTAKIKWGQTVLTIRSNQTNLALASAEQYQIFAKEPYS